MLAKLPSRGRLGSATLVLHTTCSDQLSWFRHHTGRQIPLECALNQSRRAVRSPGFPGNKIQDYGVLAEIATSALPSPKKRAQLALLTHSNKTIFS